MESYEKQILNLEKFPEENYLQSCLIYSKSSYGLFLLKNKNGDYYVVKVSDIKDYSRESAIGLFIKNRINDFPNLLVPEEIYQGLNPNAYSLFVHSVFFDDACKKENIREIFTSNKYIYYITKACSFNLQKYIFLGNKLSYYQFAGFTFQLILALQILYEIGVKHNDVKQANILVCDTHSSERIYQLGNITWFVNNELMEYKEIKLADFGESNVQLLKYSCLNVRNEIKIALINVINYMWKNTETEIQYEYEELLENLKNCQTNLYDVIKESQLFNIFLVNEVSETSKIIKLIE